MTLRRSSHTAALLTLALQAGVVLAAAPKPGGPPALPPTPKKPVTDTYHGVAVTDDYRWLESASALDVRRWSDAQNRHARAVLAKLPGVTELRARVTELATFKAPATYAVAERGGWLFGLREEPPKQQPFLVTFDSFDSAKPPRVLVDPNKLDPKGTTAIDFYVPSRDGRYVAVSMSKGGSERGDVTVFEVATRRRLWDRVPRVNGGTAGGSVAWNADGSGFYYTRYPRGQERAPEDMDFYQEVYFHKLGTKTEDDAYVIGKAFPRIAEIDLKTSHDGRHLLLTMANGDGGEFAHYLMLPGGEWRQITRYDDKVVGAAFSKDGSALYLLSRLGAPRGRLLRLPLLTPSLEKAVVVVPESDAVIRGVVPAEHRLYVLDILGGPSSIRAFGLDGTPLGNVPLPAASTVGQALCLSGDDLLFSSQGYTTPHAWYRYAAEGANVTRTAQATPSPVDLSGVEVIRETAVSKDGTKVPLTILKPKGLKADGRNPTLLTGYGGYSISLTPYFDPDRAVWFEQGGIIAIANLRGGGEFGEEWHQAGNLTRKQNVFDDFAACAGRLVELGLTKPDRLAIEGGSNGGLLMGAALTQHPELFKVVISHVGIYDMLRVEKSPNGAFNVTEFGTVKDPEQFKALYAYSPYHHVKEGVPYPDLLMLTGANDPRVDPMHSRKFAARLQAASPKTTVLLRTTSDAGHGIGSSLAQRIDQEVDVTAFLFDRLGVTYKPVEPAAKLEGVSAPASR